MTSTGDSLRHARERAGLSLAALAARTHYTKGHLSNVESGRRRATADVVLAYDRVIGDETLKRRAVVAGVASAVVAPAAVSRLISDGFSAALDGRRSAEEWEARVADYGHRYMIDGAAEVQRVLAGDLVVIQQQLEQPRLWAAAARMVAVYGKTTSDAAEAIGWYRLAAVLADRSEDDDTRVWVRARAAIALAYEGAASPVAQDFADQAVALAAGRPSLGLLNAHMARAHVHGSRGDLASAIRADDAARRVFDRVASDELVSDFAVPEWRMATFRSMLYARLGHPRGVEAQETADRTRPATLPRFATHIELHRGLALVRAGDRTEGIALARRAMAALPPERHSLSLRLMLAEVERAKP